MQRTIEAFTQQIQQRNAAPRPNASNNVELNANASNPQAAQSRSSAPAPQRNIQRSNSLPNVNGNAGLPILYRNEPARNNIDDLMI